MIDYKYGEDAVLEELEDYINRTYESHYANDRNSVQALDAIDARGPGAAFEFCMGDIIKYAMRQGKKPGEERRDILKIIHYGMLSLYFHDRMASSRY